MTSQPDYLRFLESAKQADMAEQLKADGFAVQFDLSFEQARFDLFAEKGNQKRVYEFKAGRSAKTSKENLLRLQSIAAEQGWEFHIVVVNPPPRVNVEIDSLQQGLLQFLLREMPADLEALSTHTTVLGLSDVEISDLRVTKKELKVSGMGSVDVERQYGSDSDQDSGSGLTLQDSYPLMFKATLAQDGTLLSLDDLHVDTSSFYEQQWEDA